MSIVTPSDRRQMETNMLVINYTMACALACDFCCYGCHPKRTEKMPLGLALRAINEAHDLDVFSCVGFTGGEVTLFMDELYAMAAELKKLSLRFTIATAGQWAADKNEAQMILGRLADCGLARLNISHDPSHEKFVSRQTIINAAETASERGIETYIVGTYYSPEESAEQALPELIGMPHINLVNKYVAKVGRAGGKNITQETYDLDLSLESMTCNRRVYHDIVVWHDGTVYPCCSTFNRATPGIALGNLYDSTLKELWYKAEGSMKLRIMKRQGFARLYEIVKQYDEELYHRLPSAKNFVGACSLCNHLFSNDEFTTRINGAFARYEQDQIGDLLDSLTKNFGEEKVFSLCEEALSR
jgi:MoaA/NifB/PqqE/SkfB family radical SAM enzyme